MEHAKYSNQFNFVVGVTDVKLNFLSCEPVVNTENQIIGEEVDSVAKLTLSLPLAKQLAVNLLASMEKYEQDVGPIFDLNAADESQEVNKADEGA